METRQTECCGLYEIDKLGTYLKPEDALTALFWEQREAPAMFLFTGVVKRKVMDHTHISRFDDYGDKFARLIRRMKLGKVRASHEAVNPETGNTICAWIWTVNRELYDYLSARERGDDTGTSKQACDPASNGRQSNARPRYQRL